MDVSPEDWETFEDATFLWQHPGWTWQALQDTPAEVIDLIRMLDKSRPTRRG